MIARVRRAMEEKEGGFTLIELLVVIIIIGILAAIAIPVFLSQRKKGYDAQAESDVRNLATAEETYLTDHSSYGGANDILTAENPKMAANDTVSFFTNASTGFCLIGRNSQSANWWEYDSQAGGFQAAPVKLGGAAPASTDCKTAGVSAPGAGNNVLTAGTGGAITAS